MPGEERCIARWSGRDDDKCGDLVVHLFSLDVNLGVYVCPGVRVKKKLNDITE